ncbi:hypothetical protein OFEAOIEE_LOCUS2493 [Methylorubrum extorquens]
MPYVMLWLLMTTTGGLTSGSVDFPTKEACEAAKSQFGAMLVAVSEGHNRGYEPAVLPPPEVRCIQRTTGKP